MMMQNGKIKNITEQDRLKWLEGWTEFMGKFWIEKMNQFNPPVRRTGYLQQSIKGLLHPGPVTTIEHRFAEYGIFVSKGVTPSFAWEKWTDAQGGQKVPRKRSSGGHLDILDLQYRHEHHLDIPKKTGPAFGGVVSGPMPIGRREWFAKKYYYSIQRLNEYDANYFGAAYNGMMSNFLNMLFYGGDSIVARTLSHIM
jgi:hypothetical protein